MENWDTKYTVTTKCPTCQKDYTRDVFEQELRGFLAVEMCKTCVKENSDEHGNMIIKLPRAYRYNQSNVGEGKLDSNFS